ncbi:MAG: FAD:protein FMN transferase [Pseudomonadota bacterium]
MSLSRRRFISITAGLALGALAKPAHGKPAVWRGVALGANAELVISDLPKDQANTLITLAIAEIKRLEAIFSIYCSDSVIMKLNRTGKLEAPPPELLALLTQVDAVHKATGGLFDPTIQPLWAAYAEHKGLPPADLLEAARIRTGWKHVKYAPTSIFFEKRAMALTLNGIAQGYVTDRIADLLRANGLTNAVVNIGEISALGHNSDALPWRISLADEAERETSDYVEISNRSIATSAPTGTTFDGEVSHIINPLTGKTTTSQWQRVSVIHDRAAIADGLSTAMVMMAADDMLRATKVFNGVNVNARTKDGDILRL